MSWVLERPILRIGALAASCLMLEAGCGRHAPSGPPPKPQVTVVTLHTEPVALTTELPGRVSAFRVADVRPQVNGVIQKRLFIEGDRVTAGQQLYQIDPAPYAASLESAKAALERAKAAVNVAQLLTQRYKSLLQTQAVARQDYDNALATLQQNQADVAAGEASVRTAAINLAYTKVFSPIAGRTGRSSVTEGALVTANQTGSLVTITQLDPVYVDVTQPSTTLLRLKRELASGQIRSAGADKAPVQLILEDGSTYDKPGTLQFSEVTVDQSTGSVTLRAIFPNDANLLLPGMFVRARLDEGTRQGAVLAPQQGITHAPDGSATALIVDRDSKVAERKLTLDRAIGDKWVVTDGLAEGDRLVVGGTQKVQPGTQVAVHEGAAPGSAAPAVASSAD